MKQISKGYGRDFKTGILPITSGRALNERWTMRRYILLHSPLSVSTPPVVYRCILQRARLFC